MPDEKAPEKPEPLLSNAEMDEFVNRLVDRLLDPQNKYVRELLLPGFAHPELMLMVAPLITAVVPKLTDKIALDNVSMPIELVEPVRHLIERGDKPGLTTLLQKAFFSDPLTRDQASFVFGMMDTSWLRKSLVTFAERFKMQQGRPLKLNASEYPRLVARANSLAAVILKVLSALKQGTKRTVFDLLVFWNADYPDAASFLLNYREHFEKALADPDLKERRKTLPARAKLVADAVAGLDYGLTFKTSIERVGEARRKIRQDKTAHQ